VPEPSVFEVEMTVEKLKSYKAPGTDQIPAELTKAGVEQFAMRSMNLLILFGIRRNCLRSGMNLSLYRSVKRAVTQTAVE
jgi:hypothetical protein